VSTTRQMRIRKLGWTDQNDLTVHEVLFSSLDAEWRGHHTWRMIRATSAPSPTGTCLYRLSLPQRTDDFIDASALPNKLCCGHHKATEEKTTMGITRRRDLGSEMGAAGFKYSWMKMEAAAEVRTGLRKVVCGWERQGISVVLNVYPKLVMVLIGCFKCFACAKPYLSEVRCQK